MTDFSILHNSIFVWKGQVSFKEQEQDPETWDSYCHLIIAEMDTGIPWVIAIDQGINSGTSITNCVGFLAILVCHNFELDPESIRWIEVYNHKEDQTIDEVVIKGVELAYFNQPKISFAWKSCPDETRAQANAIMDAAGQVVVNKNDFTDGRSIML